MLRKFILDNYADKPVELVTSSLYENYKLYSHIYEDRIIFYTNKNHSNYEEFPESIEANGIIFDTKWNIVCTPSINYNNKINLSKLKEMVNNYEYSIYSSSDSTILNIYYDKNKWNLGTTKGISVNDTLFNGISYMEMFKECIINYFTNPLITEESLLMDDEEFVKLMEQDKISNDKTTIWNNFWEKLDKNNTYTIGFRHPNIHKFYSKDIPIHLVYFIQSVDNKTMKVNELNNIDLPYQIKQTYTLDEMIENSKNAYETYVTKRNKPIFGYILRGTNNIIYIESSLMKHIREILYNLTPSIKEAKLGQTKAMILNNYLNHKNRPIMLNLFPQFYDEYLRFNNIINLLVNNIINYDSSTDSRFGKITSFYYNNIKDKITIGIENTDIIKDIVMNPRNLEILYDIIYN